METARVLDAGDGHKLGVRHEDGAAGQHHEVAAVLGVQVEARHGGQVVRRDVRHRAQRPLHVAAQALAQHLLALADRLEVVELLLGARGELGLVEIFPRLAQGQSHVTQALAGF